MSASPAQPQVTREQFEAQVTALATEFLDLLKGRPLTTGVVMQAAMEVHRFTAAQLPRECQGDIAMAMAAYTGELLRGLPALQTSHITH
jgi:hypothetical protein